MTHCGTVSFSSMDSVSPPESLHNNLKQISRSMLIIQCFKFNLYEECWAYLNRVLPPASPKMTGVCGGTWKYPFPFWTRFSCSPFTADSRTQSECKTHSRPATGWQEAGTSRPPQLWKRVVSGCHSYRGWLHSLLHPWGWCEFGARIPGEPEAAGHPGSLQRWRRR